MKPNQARSLLKQLYYKVDKELATMPKVCKKGCFFCCYQPIELLKFETITLADYINSELSAETKGKIEDGVLKWLDYFDKNTSDNEPISSIEAFSEFRLRAEHIPPCPLLIDGVCSVYKARPLTCRTHFVNDSRDICENDKMRDGSRQSMQYRNACVQELKKETELEIIPLAYALVNILGIDRKTKRIKKSILK